MRIIGTSPNQSPLCNGVRFYSVSGYGMVSEDLHPGIAQRFLNIPSIYAVYDGPELAFLPPRDEQDAGRLVVASTLQSDPALPPSGNEHDQDTHSTAPPSDSVQGKEDGQLDPPPSEDGKAQEPTGSQESEQTPPSGNGGDADLSNSGGGKSAGSKKGKNK